MDLCRQKFNEYKHSDYTVAQRKENRRHGGKKNIQFLRN